MPPALGVLALWGLRGVLGASSHTFAARGDRSLVRRVAAGLGAGVLVVAMSGCGTSDFASTSLTTLVPTSTRPVVTTKTKAKTTATVTATTTSSLGQLPPVLSASASPVDAAVITSLADLPAAFGCPKVPEPIVVPASGATPAALVCRSALAEEALFLWFVQDPDARFLAVKAAMRTARYVHAGQHWVAGGMVNASMGTVGGEVFKQ
jgi:hypothetical protein